MSKKISLLVAGVFLIAVIAGCSTTTSTTATTTTTASSVTTTTGAGSHALVGTWTGTWTDTKYSATGSLAVTIAQNGTALTGGGAIGLSGLGLSAEAGTASGTISGNNVSFTFNAPTVGTGSGTVSGNTITGTGTVTYLNMGAFTYLGTLDATGTTISGTFNFTSATGGHGTVEAIKI